MKLANAKKPIQVYLELDLLDALQRAAVAEMMPVAQYVRRLIHKDVSDKGYYQRVGTRTATQTTISTTDRGDA